MTFIDNSKFFCLYENECKCKDNDLVFKFHQFGKYISNNNGIKHFFIYGPDGTGKTSLVDQLKNIDGKYFENNNNVKFFYFDRKFVNNFIINDKIIEYISKELFLINKNFDLNYFEKTKDFKNLDSIGQKKMLALFSFFISLKEYFYNDKTDVKYIIVLDDVSDYLDYFDNFLIDFFIFEFIKKFGLNKKIHSTLILSHKISFLNFFINEDGNRNDSRLFRIFNDSKRFLIELRIEDLVQTDYLLFSKLINNTFFSENKISNFERNINYILFWSLSRKVIESILTSIINIKNQSSINAHRRGSFSQFYKYIDFLYLNESDEKKQKLIHFLKVWKFIQKTIIEDNVTKWVFKFKDIKNILEIFQDFFYKLKFLDEEQNNMWTQKINSFDLSNEEFEIKENEFKSWLEKNYQNLKMNSDNGVLQNVEYEKYFLVNYSYTILKLLLKEYPNGNNFSKFHHSNHEEEHKAFILIRHAGNNLFPYIFNYNKEFFDNLLKIISK